MRSNGPIAGTAFHPQVEPDLNGSSARPWSAGQLAKLPRRRRPGMIALAVALVGLGILASAALYAATNFRVPVLVATTTVPAGAVITAADVGTASVSVSPGVASIPAIEVNQVVGQVAGTTLHPGMLLAASDLTTVRPPVAGQVLVPLPIKPSILPASGLGVGDRVVIEATPGAQGQPGTSSAAPALAAPVTGVIEAVDLVTNADGYDVVDVLVAKASGDAVAAQASTGQIALIVTKRAP
jgi:SAF domain-containing protein